MSYQIILKNKAKEDIQNAFDHYEHEFPGLGDRFLLSLDDAFDRIKHSPLTPRLLEFGLRMTLLKKFTYTVYYKFDQRGIYIFAVLHGHQDNNRILGNRT